jgi:tetratricopeptide (TPR) repeat protein
LGVPIEASTGLVGREREIELLRAAVDGADAGRGRCLLIAGEPGIGKSALAEAAATYAAKRGALALWGSCWEGEGAPAFWPWVQIIRSYAAGRRTDELYAEMGDGAADIARIVPEIGGRFLSLSAADEQTSPEQAQFRLFDHVCRFLRTAAETQPLLLVLDDLHWADRSSLMLLAFFIQASRDARLLAIGTYRDVDLTADHPLRESALAAERITVRGLARHEVAELIRTTTGDEPSPRLSEAVYGKTTGNPFFVKEVVRLLDAQGRLGSSVSEYAIPEGARDVVRRRLAHLRQETVALLAAASVLGMEFPIDRLAPLVDQDIAGTLQILDEAVEARIVVELPESVGRYAFGHALVRDALYEDLGASSRAALHRRAGELIQTRHPGDAHLAEVAHHLVRGAAVGDASKAADAAIRAGRQALRMYAWDQAADMYARALDALALAGGNTALRVRTLLELGDARTRGGVLADARDAYLLAAELATDAKLPGELAHAALGLGGGLGGSEVRLFDDRQLELLDRALAELPRDDSAVRAWLLARLSVASSFVRTIDERASLSKEAIDMARRLGDRGALAYALSSVCDALAGPDHVADRLAASTEMVHLASQPTSGAARCGIESCAVCLCDPEFALLGRRLRLVANLERGDIEAADADIDAYARLAEHLRQPLYQWYAPLFRGMRALMLGDFEETERCMDDAHAVRSRMSSENANVLLEVQRAGLEMERGDMAAAERTWRAMYDLSPELSDLPSSAAFDVMVAGLSGDRADEAARLMQAWIGRGGLASQPRDSEWLTSAAYAAESAIKISDAKAAEHIYDALAPYEDLFVVDGIGARFMGSVAYYLGRLAGMLGRKDEAERLLSTATAAHEAVRAPLWAERSRDAAGIAPPAPVPEGLNVFKREGDFWTVAYDGSIARLKDSKGLRDIAALLAMPNREAPALDLASPDTPARFEGDAGEVIDDRARTAYKARIAELQQEIDEDPAGSAHARAELDALAEQLAGAYGLGGRPRRTGDPAERARKAVTERIRDAIGRLARENPALGRHLKASIRTGTFCSYTPERPVTWAL